MSRCGPNFSLASANAKMPGEESKRIVSFSLQDIPGTNPV